MLFDKEGLWYRVLKARYGEVGGGCKRVGGIPRLGGGCCLGCGRVLVRVSGGGLMITLGGLLVMVEILCSGTIRGSGKCL